MSRNFYQTAILLSLFMTLAACGPDGCTYPFTRNNKTDAFVGNNSPPFQDVRTIDFGRRRQDILWVVDNSEGMCEEQKVLRDHIDRFVTELHEGHIDFHIGLTTTHAPGTNASVDSSIVAKPFTLQSEPQPIPFGVDCIGRADGINAPQYSPLFDALDGAMDCLADPSQRDMFAWSIEQVRCVVESEGECDVPDRDGNGSLSIHDLFPLREEYRRIPRVLTLKEYSDDGDLNVPRLTADLACMSFVGTRGDGYERGLLAAVNAVSPEFTGGAVGSFDANINAPNHGLIRDSAKFSLIFVTNENDCSARNEAVPSENACGADLCDFYNSSELSEEDSPLYKISDLAQSFLSNLVATKGRQVRGSEIFIASIHGQSKRFNAPVPSPTQCKDAQDSTGVESFGNGLISCETEQLGEVRSGDRYARFMRQFSNYYPENRPGTDGSDINASDVGWLCEGDFSPALEAIGEFIVKGDPACIKDTVFPCEESTQCPSMPYTGAAGSCVDNPHPENPNKYCDSGVALRLTLVDPAAARFADINSNPFCEPESIQGTTCLVSRSKYNLVACQAAVGMIVEWEGITDVQADQELTGYQLNLRYNVIVGGSN